MGHPPKRDALTEFRRVGPQPKLAIKTTDPFTVGTERQRQRYCSILYKVLQCILNYDTLLFSQRRAVSMSDKFMGDRDSLGQAIVVFTFKRIDHILRDGGTSAWKLRRNHARISRFVVCTRNAHSERVEGPEEHCSAFLIGRVTDVVLAPEHDDRYLIQFDEFARVAIPNVWRGDRNPVRYTTLQELGIDPATLNWEHVPEHTPNPDGKLAPSSSSTSEISSPLSIAEAKRGLALTFGVAPEAIEITIRG
jgi:hypothetical protein